MYVPRKDKNGRSEAARDDNNCKHAKLMRFNTMTRTCLDLCLQSKIYQKENVLRDTACYCFLVVNFTTNFYQKQQF